MQQNHNAIAAVFLSALVMTSCKVDLSDGDSFEGGNSQRKESSKSASIDGTKSSENKTVAKGSYLVRVALHEIANDDTAQVPTLDGLKSASKGCICVGAMFLHIKEDFSIEFPKSKLNCSLIGDLDLEKILSGMNDKGDREKAAEANDKMLRLKKLGPLTFDPPRPLLVGPIIQDPDQYIGLTETKNYSVEYQKPDNGGITADSGSITVNVLEAGATLTPIFMANKTFNSILRFEMLSRGFRKIPRSGGFLFDQVEFTLNSRPLAIPAIKIQSKVADILPASSPSKPGGPSLADSFFVKWITGAIPIYIRLDATTFETY